MSHRKYNWRAVDWRRATGDIARELGCDASQVSRMRRRVAPREHRKKYHREYQSRQRILLRRKSAARRRVQLAELFAARNACIARAHRAGATSRDLSEVYGLTPSSMRSLLRDLGLRSKGRIERHHDELLVWWARGDTQDDIARRIGCTVLGLSLYMRRRRSEFPRRSL